ncbi:MAG: 2,4-diaminopentanoate dehydrogenase [Bacillota bacterium]
MKRTRVLHWGLGAMGAGAARMVLGKQGLELAGAVCRTPSKLGKDIGDILGVGKTGAQVSSSLAEALGRGPADIVIHATGSFTREVYGQLVEAVHAGLDVITIAEEMAYPWVGEPELARSLDELAKAKGVTVLGTGVNPGFVLDTLVITLTGACIRVDSIRAARVNDLSPFGPTVMRTQGVGTTLEEFQAGVAAGNIVGHVGFPESMTMIAKAIGWELDEIKQEKQPIVSKVYRETPHVKVQPGMVAGCNHTAWGYMDGRVVITLEHPQQIHPGLAGVETGDYIWITGEPNINVANKPEVPGGIGTIATSVNMIPLVRAAAPGLLTMADLPLPRATMGRS